MKAAFVLAALALLVGAASAQTLTDCKVDMGTALASNCDSCDTYYPSTLPALRTKCYQCLINMRGTGQDLDDCWSPNDDAAIPAIYGKCMTTRCFDCLTNFKLKSDPKLDLCKMVESAYSSSTLRNLAFDCLSNTQGDSTTGFNYYGTTYLLLNTSPCIQISPIGNKKCSTPNCFYCITNFASAPDRWTKWQKCKTCEAAGSNFWSCVYSK